MASKLKMEILFLLALFTLLVGKEVFASESVFDYPELSVVPHASEQIAAESAHEKDSAWSNHLPLLIPATTSVLAGAVELALGTKADDPQNIKNGDTSAKVMPYVAMGVGLAWWGVAYGILNHADYYSSAVEEVGKLPNKTQRDQLMRERRAEEAISKAGSMARKLKWISFATNCASGVLVSVSAKEKTAGTAFGVAAAITSLTPILFQHRWEELDNRHQDYKKRIYAPVAGVTLLKDPSFSSAFSPGISLSMSF